MKKLLLATAISGAFGFNALAVEPVSHTTDSGVVITPMLQTEIKSDDNIYSQSNNEESSTIFTVAPSANFMLDDGVNQYALDLGISSATYFDHSDDNMLDGNIALSAHLEPSSAKRLDIQAGANWITEPRGTGISEGAAGASIDEPIRYVEQIAALTYEYGALSSKGRVAFDGRYYEKDYSNFSSITRTRDQKKFLVGVTYFYSTNSKTDAFLELNMDNINYDHLDSSGISRNSEDYAALAGVTWQATALTSGTAKLGYQRKAFDDSAREDFSGLSWDIGVEWQPLSYSTVNVNTARKAKDPTVEGDYIRESSYALNWTHNWSNLLSTSLSGSYLEEDYQGVSRSDDTTTVRGSVDYDITRWADVSLFVEVTDKDSTLDNIYFDKNVVGLNFTVSL